ncbi:MAG: hypothetical protein ACE14P_01880 [Methanotrichaceae archaeon]
MSRSIRISEDLRCRYKLSTAFLEWIYFRGCIKQYGDQRRSLSDHQFKLAASKDPSASTALALCRILEIDWIPCYSCSGAEEG